MAQTHHVKTLGICDGSVKRKEHHNARGLHNKGEQDYDGLGPVATGVHGFVAAM